MATLNGFRVPKVCALSCLAWPGLILGASSKGGGRRLMSWACVRVTISTSRCCRPANGVVIKACHLPRGHETRYLRRVLPLHTLYWHYPTRAAGLGGSKRIMPICSQGPKFPSARSMFETPSFPLGMAGTIDLEHMPHDSDATKLPDITVSNTRPVPERRAGQACYGASTTVIAARSTRLLGHWYLGPVAMRH